MTSIATARVIGLVLLASPLVLVYFTARIIVCLRSASLNWMSPCRRMSFSCRACVGCLVCKIPLLARRTRPKGRQAKRARDDRVSCIQSAVVCVSPDCQAAFARLLVARASPSWMSSGWQPDYLVRAARLTRYINGPMPDASILCIARYPSVAHALDQLSLGQVRARAKVSCIQFKTRQGNFSVCAQGSSVNSNMILLCLYIFIECV